MVFIESKEARNVLPPDKIRILVTNKIVKRCISLNFAIVIRKGWSLHFIEFQGLLIPLIVKFKAEPSETITCAQACSEFISLLVWHRSPQRASYEMHELQSGGERKGAGEFVVQSQRNNTVDKT